MELGGSGPPPHDFALGDGEILSNPGVAHFEGMWNLGGELFDVLLQVQGRHRDIGITQNFRFLANPAGEFLWIQHPDICAARGGLSFHVPIEEDDHAAALPGYRAALRRRGA